MISIGLGLGIGHGVTALGAPVFDPLTLSPTGWWRATYAGSPWADDSGNGRTLTEPTNPPSTHASGGADFDGTNDVLHGTALTTLFGTSGSIWCLFWSDDAPAPVAAYRDGSIIGDPDNGELNFGFTSSGIGMCVLDNSVTYQRIDVACGTGAWHLGQAKWNGTTLRARVDSGSWSSIACGPFTRISAGNAYVGASFLNAIRFNGRIRDLGVKNAALSDANFDSVLSYVNARYGLAL